MGKRRAWVLLFVHVLLFAHLLHWQLSGRSLSLMEPSEGLYTAARGVVNAGLILLLLALLVTLVFGRWFCGWACHLVALQDLCGWLLKKIGLRPRPVRSRMLVYAPLLAGLYLYLGPLLVRWVRDLRGDPNAEWRLHSEFVKADLWETMPGFWVGLITLLVSGFVIVYVLGAKGFCTYACPYGGLFGMAERLAPGRIRVTDACRQCGHCTATCSSNVLVHKEVHEYGMVVDPGCMKCLDCTSVCPQGALYFGFGRPAVSSKLRVPDARPRKRQFSRGEELALAGLMVLSLLIFSGIPRGLVPGLEIDILYGETPLLLALALAALTAFLAVMLVRLWRRADMHFQHHTLKQGGRLRRPGLLFLLAAGAWCAFVLHSAVVQTYTFLGTRGFNATVTPELDAPIWSQNARELERLAAGRRAALDACRSQLETAVRLGLFAHSGLETQLGWLALVDLDPRRAERHMRRAIEANADYPDYHWALYRILGLQERRAEALVALEEAVRLRPDSETYHLSMAREMADRNRLDEALEHLRRVTSLGGAQADVARMYQVGIHARRGTTPAMEPLLREVLRNHPEHLPALATLEQLLRSMGRAEEASEVAERIRRLQAPPGRPSGQ